MKPNVKIPLLLGVVILAISASVWLSQQSRRPRRLSAAPQTSHLTPTSRPVPLAKATPGPAPSAPEMVPESIQSIVRDGSATTFQERVSKIHGLPANLAAEEIHACYAYLLAPSPAGAENRQQENCVRNELMDKLAEAPSLPAGLARVLVTIYQDAAQDIVMRDYAVQHMTPIYARASAEEKAILQQTLWSALAETDSSIAGTALLALRELAQSHREFEPNRLAEVAMKLAEDDRCGELSRITALQVCGRLGLNPAAPLMLQLAQKADSVPLQIAAIAALGDVGDAAARNCLRQLVAQPESRLRPALETALKKLNSRLGI